ncbi:MAG TPA: hypothetical protein VIM11_10130 [Tepidisphaeraceae bacterium]|jgi:hypothetical protein
MSLVSHPISASIAQNSLVQILTVAQGTTVDTATLQLIAETVKPMPNPAPPVDNSVQTVLVDTKSPVTPLEWFTETATTTDNPVVLLPFAKNDNSGLGGGLAAPKSNPLDLGAAYTPITDPIAAKQPEFFGPSHAKQARMTQSAAEEVARYVAGQLVISPLKFGGTDLDPSVSDQLYKAALDICLKWKPGQDLAEQLGLMVVNTIHNPLSVFPAASIVAGLRSYGSTGPEIARNLFTAERDTELGVARNLG